MPAGEIDPGALAIPGIEIIDEVGRGTYGVVFRAMRGDRMLAVKVFEPIEDGSDLERGIRFRREAASLACLRHPALPEIVDAGQVGERPYLIMEYVDGSQLSSQIGPNYLSPDAVARIGIELAGALAEVHRHGLVHRDVTPNNIIRIADGACKLVDFGLARWHQTGSATDEVAGSFLYAAPEQTGVLKRALDGRADLYALGAVLFEVATGRPPFQATTIAEMLHHHAVRTPPNVADINPGFPAALSAIIAKLLAKDPDDRYQSGESLTADLERIEALDQALSVGHPIELGARSAQPVAATSEFVGRHEHLALLEESWNKARKIGAVVHIEGDAGSGKSRLLKEYIARREARGSLVLRGGCSANDVTPLLSLRRVFENALGSRPQADPNGAPHDVATVLREAAADLAPFLSRLSPELGRLFDTRSDHLEPLELHEQFFDAVADYLLRVAHRSPGAVLFIDDGQWLDDASRQVLRRVMRHIRDAPLQLIVAARPIEADGPGLAFLDVAAPLRLILPPLDHQTVAELVAANLGGYQLDPKVATRIAKRSGGNPFAVIEYVRAMLDGGMLRPSWNGWVVDGEHSALPMSHDVVELVLQRLGDFDSESRAVLHAAAMIGSRFPTAVLSAACGVDGVVVERAMTQAIRAALIERLTPTTCAFTHDRIREALQSGFGELERGQLHARIASAYEAMDDDDPQLVFAIARHCNMAKIPDPARLYRVNLAAGLQAVNYFADEIAFEFLQNARSLADSSGRPLELELIKTLGEVCARTGRLEAATEYLEASLDLATVPLARAEILRRLGHVHLANYNTSRTWTAVSQGFKELGRRQVRSTFLATLACVLRTAFAGLGYLFGVGYGTASEAERPRLRVLLEVYNTAGIVAYFSANDFALVQLVLLAFREAWRLGPSRGLVNGYSGLCVLLSVLRLRRFALWIAARARSIATEIDDPRAMAQAKIYTAFCHQILGDEREGERLVKQCLDQYGPWVEINDFSNACWSVAWGRMMRGYAREAWTWTERAVDRAELSATPDGLMQASWSYGPPVFAALGEPTMAADYLARSETLADAQRDEVYRRADFLGHKLLFCLEQEDWNVAPNVIREYLDLGLKPSQAEMHIRDFYVGRAYVCLHGAVQAQQPDRRRALAQLDEAMKDLRVAAVIPALQAHRLVLEAARARLASRPQKAERFLERAGRSADEADSPWAWFEIHQQRAWLQHDAGDHIAAQRHARFAEALALRHGWLPRLRRLRSAFHLEGTSTGLSSGTPPRLDATSNVSALRTRREMDALLQMSVAAATVHDPDQRAQIALDELIRLLGAERAFLFLSDRESGELRLLASRDAAGQSMEPREPYSQTVVDRVRTTKQALVVAGSEQGELLGSTSIVAHDLRSIIAAPLMMRDDMMGLVYLDNRLAKGVFTEGDVEILLALGGHVAVALENARATQLEMRVEAERENRRLAEQLNGFVASLSSSLDLDKVIERLLQELDQALSPVRAAVLLQEAGVFRVAGSKGYADQAALRQLEESFGKDSRSSALLQSCEAMTDPSIGASDSPDGGIAWMGIPLGVRDERKGFLILERGTRVFEANDLELATMFAGQGSMAIENARLFAQVNHLATTDELTGVASRRHFYYLAEREVSRAKRHRHPLVVMMADVDHFKTVNDTYGHGIGDAVLKTVASRLSRSLRDADLLGRYGGEEFVFLLPETELETAKDLIAERLREAIAGPGIETESGSIRVTVSVGVCGDPAGESSLTELLKGADAALYAAKRAGRNCVVGGSVAFPASGGSS